MGFYIGARKSIVHINGVPYQLRFYSSIPIIEGIKLITYDDYILKDINGLYLTAI